MKVQGHKWLCRWGTGAAFLFASILLPLLPLRFKATRMKYHCPFGNKFVLFFPPRRSEERSLFSQIWLLSMLLKIIHMRKVFQQWRRSDSWEWVPGRNIFVALLQFLYYVGIYFAHFHSTCRLLLIFNFFENKNLQDGHCVFQTPWQFLAAMIVLLRRVYNAINIPFLRVITDLPLFPLPMPLSFFLLYP